jgi:hypothetical protein
MAVMTVKTKFAILLIVVRFIKLLIFKINIIAGPSPAFSNYPTLLHKEGFNLNPKPLCPLQGRGLTAPPVALSLRYARTIKGPAWVFIG